MCTGIVFRSKDHYFGRNLDLDYSYNEEITICPRNYEFNFRNGKVLNNHFAIIGMATNFNGYPLFYDACNEKGVSIAGLNFPKNAKFNEKIENKENIATFEFIPWVLTQCSNIEDVINLCDKINLTNESFNKEFPVTPLHWIIGYKDKSVVVEQTKDGFRVFENPVGVLTNNPTFDKQLFNLNNYRNLSIKNPENTFFKGIDLETYSLGLGGLGLPGDLSSMSRFVRATFTKLNSICSEDENSSVSQFFHILGSVNQQYGICFVEHSGKYEYTIYSSCINTDKGIYYYKTYNNSQISAVDMNKEDLESKKLITYSLILDGEIKFQN